MKVETRDVFTKRLQMKTIINLINDIVTERTSLKTTITGKLQQQKITSHEKRQKFRRRQVDNKTNDIDTTIIQTEKLFFLGLVFF